MTICQNIQQDTPPSMSSKTHVTDIHYVTTSVNESMRFPSSLCDSLYHFTYQCPMIIEYRRRQMDLIQYRPNITPPVMQVTLPIPSPDTVHINSPEPESLPIPPCFIDSLSEDFPPNPPNSSVHFPQEILPPPTVHNPQCMNIWFLSSMPSHHLCDTPSTSSPLEDNHKVTVTNVSSLDPLYSLLSHCEEDILVELTTPDFTWNALHHRALFLSQECL
jgi:hypothetical protein